MVDAEVLAIIPARGGSKGIPRKNIKAFAGHPLIAYSIEAGLQARNVNRVIVSTDDEEIAAVARAYGAETPFLRPAEFAQDRTLDLPVFQHALEWLAAHEGYQPGCAGAAAADLAGAPARAGGPGRGDAAGAPGSRIRCAGWCLPGRTRIRCGASTPKAGG